MAKLKLIKARSYSGLVRATAKQPFVDVDTDEEAQALVATGYFEFCASTSPDTSDKEEAEGSSPDYDALSAMTKAELLKYAEENDIDVEGCKTKADILEVISAANGGSYTMMELQEE